MLVGELGVFETLSGNLAQLEHERMPGGAAVSFDISVALRAQDQIEGFAPLLQGLHGGDQLRSGNLIEPRGEMQKLVRLARNAELLRQIGDQQFRLAGFCQGEKHLRLRGQYLVERTFMQAIKLGLMLCRDLRAARALGGAQAGDGRAHGKGDDAEIDAEHEKRLRVERKPFGSGQCRFRREQSYAEGSYARQPLRPP